MKVWLFGEAELETTDTLQQSYEKLFDVSENCGYMIQRGHKVIKMMGSDNEGIEIFFEGNKRHVRKCQYDDNGHIIQDWNEVEY